MTHHIVLDSSPLSLLSSPTRAVEVLAINQWATDCLLAGHHIYVPEISDYELRRELLRAGKTVSVARLDRLKAQFDYLPITTESMLRAAALWAQARNSGLPTGDPKKLDIDVILAAQALTLSALPSDVVVATSNVSHLSRFMAADEWKNITP
jgi:predicted nucleic acid-binding protein